MHTMAMTGTFRAAVKTHQGANGIFPPKSVPFLEIQIYPVLMYYRKEKGEKEWEKKMVKHK